MAVMLRRYGGDMVEIWPGCGRGVVEVWSRCGRGVAEVWRRCGGGVTEMWRECGGDGGGRTPPHSPTHHLAGDSRKQAWRGMSVLGASAMLGVGG